MKAKAICELATALIYEKVGDSGEDTMYSVPLLNMLLQECFEVEQSIRKYKSETVLASAPLITSLEDDVPYHDELTRAAIPYGLAARFFAMEDDAFNADYMRGEYRSCLALSRKYVWGEIEDAY